MTLSIPSDVESLLSNGMVHELIRQFESGGVTYFLIDQFDRETASEVIVAKRADSAPTIIEGDTLVLLDPNLNLPIDVKKGLSAGLNIDAVLAAAPFDRGIMAGGVLLSQSQLDNDVLVTAQASVNTLDTSTVPGTNHGHLACAWAVNTIIRKALGRPIVDSLSTTVTGQRLKVQDRQVAESSIGPGMIIISPTDGAKVGHVGIIGPLPPASADPGGRLIYSNSSSKGVFAQNFTLSTWKQNVGEARGLPVLFYDLSPSAFPQPGPVA
jgi:hypothetical protein